MDYFAGLDVSVKDTSVCIVDSTGKIVREVKVASEPEAPLAVLTNPAYHFKRIGLEAGPVHRAQAGGVTGVVSQHKLTKYWCTKAPSFWSGSRSFFLYTGSVKSRFFGTMILRGVAILVRWNFR